jgi:hypothetical protein
LAPGIHPGNGALGLQLLPVRLLSLLLRHLGEVSVSKLFSSPLMKQRIVYICGKLCQPCSLFRSKAGVYQGTLKGEVSLYC